MCNDAGVNDLISSPSVSLLISLPPLEEMLIGLNMIENVSFRIDLITNAPCIVIDIEVIKPS